MKRRVMSMFLALVMVVGMMPLFPTQVQAAEATSGKCGENLTWTLDADGTLTINGTGNMNDYTSTYYRNPAPWYSQRASIKKLSISYSVTSIGNYAFFGCTGLTSINIPSSVTTIGNDAFSCCKNLADINIPNSVTSIGDYTFYNCTSLNSINIPDSVTFIGNYAFESCEILKSVYINNIDSYCKIAFSNPDSSPLCNGANLYINNKLVQYLEIPSSIVSIGSCTFCGCTSLTSINIPSSVTFIGNYAFYGCSNLVNINIPNSVTSIESYALAECLNLRSVNIPNSINSIKDYTFWYSTGLTNINIPSSVTSIGNCAFQGCSGLISINIPNSVTSIGYGAFDWCTSLSNINIPNSVTAIQDSTFRNCTNLHSINIPSSVTSIGYDAFKGSGLTSIIIPNSVTSIKGGAFWNCSKLSSVFFDGNAPSVSSLIPSGSYSSYSSFPASTTLYYISGKSGWTSPTWQGYKTATWSGFLPSSITPMDFGDIVINASGRGYAHFKVTDENNEALPGARFQCTLSSSNGSTERELVSDGNGILSVETPTVNSDQEFSVSFQPIENSIKNGLEQTIKVKAKQLSYEHNWRGETNFGGKIGASDGGGVEAGVAKVEATLAEAVAGAERGAASSISESFEDGVRNLEIEYEKSGLLELGVKSGVDASLCDKVNVSLVSASLSVKGGNSDTIGLRIENYDPKANPSQMMDVGKFLLQMVLLGDANSLFANEVLSALNVNSANQYSNTLKAAVSGNASALELKVGDEKAAVGSIALANANTNRVWSFSNSVDSMKNERTFTRSLICDRNAGLLGSPTLTASQDSTGIDTYLLGGSLSNHKEISATVNLADSSLKNLSYKTYDGAETDLLITSKSKDTYATVTYENEALKKLLSENPSLVDFSVGNLLAADIQDTIDMMVNSKQLAQVKETKKIKQGAKISFPFGFSAGFKVGVSFGLSGEESYSYDNQNSVIYNGTVYPTAVSDQSVDREVSGYQKDLKDILLDPVKKAWNSVKEKLSAVWGSVKDGVNNACATVKSKASDFYVGITSMFSQKNRSIQSYAILSLEDEGTPNSDAALSVTLGDPYLVEVYTDESQETLVTDEQLAASPLTLTLEYTDEMLKAAGATAETEVKIYHYDAERNVYVCLPESKQDREAKSVTAQITQQGEYILAVDTAAPCVSDFKPSDGTAKPTLTALVSDLSGLKDFSFWIDDGDALVTKENLKDYYVEKTGVFTYAVTDLSVGEHTAYFMAEDTLGNRLTEPVSFTFTVQDFSVVLPAPAVPSETVRDGCFTVTTPAPKDGSVEGMTLVLETEDGRLVSIPMTLENDTWTAEVTDLSGSGTLKVYTIAADAYGNTVESKKQEVKVEEDKEEVTVTSLALGDLLSLDGKAGVKVNVTNGEEGAISALLNVAFYDEKGKQLDVVQTGVGLTGHETQTYTVGSSVSSNQVAKIKAFLLDCADGYTPLCTPVGK